MSEYVFMIYRSSDGLIIQMTKTNEMRELLPPKGNKYEYVAFYNDDILGMYYDPENGRFYEDEEKTIEIIEPKTYARPVKDSEQRIDLEQAIIDSVVAEVSK